MSNGPLSTTQHFRALARRKTWLSLMWLYFPFHGVAWVYVLANAAEQPELWVSLWLGVSVAAVDMFALFAYSVLHLVRNSGVSVSERWMWLGFFLVPGGLLTYTLTVLFEEERRDFDRVSKATIDHLDRLAA